MYKLTCLLSLLIGLLTSCNTPITDKPPMRIEDLCYKKTNDSTLIDYLSNQALDSIRYDTINRLYKGSLQVLDGMDTAHLDILYPLDLAELYLIHREDFEHLRLQEAISYNAQQETLIPTFHVLVDYAASSHELTMLLNALGKGHLLRPDEWHHLIQFIYPPQDNEYSLSPTQTDSLLTAIKKDSKTTRKELYLMADYLQQYNKIDLHQAIRQQLNEQGVMLSAYSSQPYKIALHNPSQRYLIIRQTNIQARSLFFAIKQYETASFKLCY